MRIQELLSIFMASVLSFSLMLPASVTGELAYDYTVAIAYCIDCDDHKHEVDSAGDFIGVEPHFICLIPGLPCMPGSATSYRERRGSSCSSFCDVVYLRTVAVCQLCFRPVRTQAIDSYTLHTWNFNPGTPDQHLPGGITRPGTPAWWNCTGCGRTRPA